MRTLVTLFAAVTSLLLAGCGYNDLQRQDEGIKAAWSEVLNQYQRRADLVPNLVNTVKGYAAQEQAVLVVQSVCVVQVKQNWRLIAGAFVAVSPSYVRK